jgi:hypothetical protein
MMRPIWILWPSFVVAGIAEAVFFTLFDPADLHIFGEPLTDSRTAVYTMGFLVFWFFAAASSAFTCFLQRSAAEVNRMCPLEPEGRPPGCPKRLERNCGTQANGIAR